MSALDRDILSDACRAFYELAAESYVLPPLTREAGVAPDRPSHVLTWDGGHHAITLKATLHKNDDLAPSSGPSRLPLRVTFELADAVGQPCDLAECDRQALLRAFFLGAKAPISIDCGKDNRYRISIQLSSTYFVACGQLPESAVSPYEICRAVGERLSARTTDFFADDAVAQAIWTTRAGQYLLDEPRPSADTFWPRVQPIVWPKVARAAITRPAMTRPVAAMESAKPPALIARRYAFAASVAIGCFGLAGLGAATWSFGEPAPTEIVLVAEASVRTPAAPPVAVARGIEVHAAPSSTNEPVPVLGLIAPDPSRHEAMLREPAPPPIPPVATESLVRFAANPVSANPVLVVASRSPSLPLALHPAAASAQSKDAKSHSLTPPHRLAQKKSNRVAPNVLARAVGSFAKVVQNVGTTTARGIGRLPRRFASLITGRSVGR
jgi:hypothetical protein